MGSNKFRKNMLYSGQNVDTKERTQIIIFDSEINLKVSKGGIYNALQGYFSGRRFECMQSVGSIFDLRQL
jgi:methyl coenzyme M reductase subunit D